MATQLTEEERAALTPEELEALEDDTLVDPTNDPGAAEGDEEDEDEDQSQGADDNDPADAGQDDGAPPAKPADGSGQDEADSAAPADDAPAERAPYVPQPVAVPEETTKRIEAIGAELDALADKFDEGDLTGREFRDASNKLMRERDGLQEQVLTANLTNKITAQQVEQAWYADVNTFLAEHPEIGKSQLRLQAYDQVVRQVTGDEANANLSNVKKLEMAHKLWADELGIEVSGKKPAPTPKPAPKADEKPPKARDVPKTLSGVPAAQVQETDDGEFGQLDRLFNSRNKHDVLKAEEMLARLPDDKRRQYMAQ